MALNNLFDDDADDTGEENCTISINKKYAQKYQKFKECQELDRLKEKYGDEGGESSSTSESEDDDAEALTPQIEKDFLRTLSMIKEKDPKIYEKDSIFFITNKDSTTEDEATNSKNENEKKTKQQPVFLKDYERQRLLEKGDKAYLSDSDNDEIENMKLENGVTYVEEQNELQKNLMSAAHSDSDSDDDLLQIRNDISENAKKELEKGDIQIDEGAKINVLNRYWKNEDIDEGEKFLRDYILKKQFIDETNASRVPTYNEVVEDLDEDLEKEYEFERKFNFRYEDPDPEFIKQYPRTISESVRRKDDRRKQHRKEREERKKKEKEKKKDELKRLKNLKRKEIMEKIEKLKEITGNEKVGFLEEDMMDDFDVSKYDELMEKVFDDEYYNDGNMENDEKPVFPDDEYFEDDGNYDDEYIPHCEDAEFNMDADYNPKDVSKNSKKKRKGMNERFSEAIQREKPFFDPKEKTFEEYFDEYYKLDFEDIIDDIPIRFKYRQVIPNDFGLSTDEILKAEDKELNEWCSLKKTMQYVGDDDEKKLQQKFKKKARDKKKKVQVFPSMREELEEKSDKTNGVNLEAISKPRNITLLQKKKKKTLISSWNSQHRRSILSTVNKSKMKHIRNRFKGGDNKFINKLSLQRLAAYGLDERKNKSV